MMILPDLSTLVTDIYNVLDSDNDHEASEDNLEALGRNIADLVRSRLRTRESRGLSMSSVGKPDRQLWYSLNKPELAEKMHPKAHLKFLYGDIIEQVLLFLSKEAGHDVSHEQHEIEIDGIKGHLDAVIDGVTVDVKSASPYGFKKFQTGALFEDDAFGYVDQLSGYSSEVTPTVGGAFFAAEKVSGEITLLSVDADTVRERDTAKRISHLKEVIKQADPPARCYSPKPEGKSGNMILGVNCSYCAFKNECWKDANGGVGLKKYLYYSGPKWFTHVEREPKVSEF